MPKKGAAPTGDKRLGFFAAIEKQKLETVRWSMLHGGQFYNTRNDENETCLHVCAMNGKDRALGEILEILGRQNSRRGGSSRSEAGEAVDGLELTNDEGMTPLMLAARRGAKPCMELLVKAGAKVNNVVRPSSFLHMHRPFPPARGCKPTQQSSMQNLDDGRKTAKMYAQESNLRGIVEWFDRGCKDAEVELKSNDTRHE